MKVKAFDHLYRLLNRHLSLKRVTHPNFLKALHFSLTIHLHLHLHLLHRTLNSEIRLLALLLQSSCPHHRRLRFQNIRPFHVIDRVRVVTRLVVGIMFGLPVTPTVRSYVLAAFGVLSLDLKVQLLEDLY